MSGFQPSIHRGSAPVRLDAERPDVVAHLAECADDVDLGLPMMQFLLAEALSDSGG